MALKAPELERKSRNERHFAAAWYGKRSGFEVVHGLLDRIMLMLKTSFRTPAEEDEIKTPNHSSQAPEYWISQDATNATFFEGHAATIHVRIPSKGSSSRENNNKNTNANTAAADDGLIIGVLGILHPTVLEKFELKYPVSTLEINLEPFL